MAESVTVADLQCKIDKLTQEFDSYRNEKENELLKMQNCNRDLEKKIKAVNNEFKNLRNEMLKQSSNSSLKFTAADLDRQTQLTRAKISDVESFIGDLQSRSEIEPFAKLLPDVINLMKSYPNTTYVQENCLQLLNNLFQKGAVLTEELKSNLVEMLLTCLQSNAICLDDKIISQYANAIAELRIFADPIDKYTKTVEILLQIISNPEMTTKTKLPTIRLLSEILLKSDENRCNIVGQMGCVEQICAVVRQQIANSTYDRLLLICWNCIQNLCSLSLENKEKLISIDGMELLHSTYVKFGDQPEIIGRLLTIMESLSGVPSLRPHLLTEWCFKLLWEHLIKFRENNSFNDVLFSTSTCDLDVVVRTFNNLLSDPTIIWPLESPTAGQVQKCLTDIKNQRGFDGYTAIFVMLLAVLFFGNSTEARLIAILPIVILCFVLWFGYWAITRLLKMLYSIYSYVT